MTIEEQLNNIDWKNHTQVIDFYESNLVYFENYQFINDQEKISDFIDIKLHYSNSAKYYFDVLGFIRRNELGGFSGLISWKCHSFILSGEADMGTTGKQPEWEYPD